jgi:hypothetical protein
LSASVGVLDRGGSHGIEHPPPRWLGRDDPAQREKLQDLLRELGRGGDVLPAHSPERRHLRVGVFPKPIAWQELKARGLRYSVEVDPVVLDSIVGAAPDQDELPAVVVVPLLITHFDDALVVEIVVDVAVTGDIVRLVPEPLHSGQFGLGAVIAFSLLAARCRRARSSTCSVESVYPARHC